jgi:hypothetical protein
VVSRYEAVSIDRLKPHLGSQPFLAVPPSRGRPLQRPPVGSSSGPQASTGGGDVRAVMFDSILYSNKASVCLKLLKYI